MSGRCGEHEGKTPFHSKGIAWQAIRRIQRSSEHGSKRPCRPYQCVTCGRWFLTSKP